ncbi:MAG: family 16 glycoside hydrolase [Planctomycetaceae bacterium]
MLRKWVSFSVVMWMLAVGVIPTVVRGDDEKGFKPIFDGKTLNGWRAWAGDEKFWRVEEGMIVGESTEANPCTHNTFLVWDQGQVDDFELRLQFRISGTDAANSGIQFRGVQREDGHVIGYQADIDRAGNWVGALYDEAQRGMLAKRGEAVTLNPEGQERKIEQVGDAADIFSKIDINDWNEYSIKAIGKVITLSINGHQTVKITDNDPAGYDPFGLLALQLHSGPPMKIEWKNIRLKRFPLSDGRKKIVFVAGSPSHGYFSHEHNAGCLLLAEKLNTAAKEHALPVVAAVYKNGWPKDPTAMDNVDCVVSYCDGGGRHYLNDRLDDFDHLALEHGVGLVCIHYAVETTQGDCGDHFLKWMGGYFEPHWSVNPHWTAKFENLPKHPITQGVGTIEVNDEWYYHMRFVPEMKGVTPILSALPPRETLNRGDGPHSGNPHVRAAVLERKEPQHVAWAYERPNGKGRGFGFTGGHFHKNWQDDNFRKIVLNAIVWAAKLEVPKDGVPSATPTQEELEANQDEPKPGEKKEARTEKKEAKAQAVQLGKEDVKSAFSSKVIDVNTPEHAVEIDVDITGAKGLWLVVTDGGNGFACDWADWVEPRLIQPVTENRIRVVDGQEVPYTAVNEVTLPLTTLKWKAASAGHGEVRKDMNSGGDAMRVAGKPVSFGIGTHANSVIEYELPAGHKFTRFKAKGGLDNGGTDQGACGSNTSVQFHVFTQRPAAAFLSANSGAGNTGGGGGPLDHEVTHAIEQLDVHPDLTATVFASEPMMTNPASIDIDHLGRVWVCEAINYRAFRNQDIIGDMAKEGDRILVLEDTDYDGVADKSTVFHQGHDVDSAHGILVLPSVSGKSLRALVSAGDSVFWLIDEDGDLKSDKKELLFTGIDGTQHDHGIHAFHFGPDGKLYFNFGNAGKRIKDKEGKPIVDKAGNEVNDSRKPYQEGMVFRCNMDGSQFETLGWNFRNNWEACVDSYGTIWQSDNDDDGNRGVRINYVMEYGNYGYKDEFTGAAWNQPRTNLETEVPLRHWHLNDPGVMPNLLQTGAGAPTGICIYEGDLLPMFRGAVLHCDAGPNIFRAYVTKPAGAGYSAEIVNILDGARNKWFRPSDACVAPDGSVLVADWYDPGVGGHRMQDAAHGRIFRVAPKGDAAKKYMSPKIDVSTVEGAIAALKSPNMTARYLGWTALHSMGDKSVPALEQMLSDKSDIFRARALWSLGKLHIAADMKLSYITQALGSGNNNLAITAIRLGRQLIDELPAEKYKGHVSLDNVTVPVAREILIALRDLNLEAAPIVWTALASQYDGQDRWYLEALGLAAEGHWDTYLPLYLESQGDNWNTKKAARDIVWRSRATNSPQLLQQMIANSATPSEEVPRDLRAFDFLNSPSKQTALMELAFASVGNAEVTSMVNGEALNRLGGDALNKPEMKAALAKVLDNCKGTAQYVNLVSKFNISDRYADLLAIAQANPQTQLAVDATKALLDKGQQKSLSAAVLGDDAKLGEATILALATSGDGRAAKLLQDVALNAEQPLDRRRAAIKGMGAIRQGAQELQKLAEKGGYDEGLTQALTAALHTSQWKEIKDFAEKKFPLPPGKEGKPLPTITQLSTRSGDAKKGGVLFHSTATCAQCHQVNDLGKNVGPDLSEIGKKLTKEALYESILFPSAAISHNFENWMVVDDGGNQYAGLLVSETPSDVQIKDAKGIVHTIPTSKIEIKKKQELSLMPADVQKLLTAEELVDVVEYLTTLKQKK